MDITAPAELIGQLNDTLAAATFALNNSTDRIVQLTKELDQTQLLNEAQACAYLKRDAPSLAYYRRLGLESYKKGDARWYMKGEIDAWLASGKVSQHKN